MKYFITGTLIISMLLVGCSSFNNGYSSVPGIVDRAMLPNLWLNGADTGNPVVKGVGLNDALVVTYTTDLIRIWDLRIAEYNGASVGAALTQATMMAAIAGIALGRGPVAAAGGVAAASLFLQHVFGIVDTPAKANAYLGGKELLVNAMNEYVTGLAADSCDSTTVSGTLLTGSGALLDVRSTNAEVVVQKQLQMTIPTLEQMQAATVDRQAMSDRMARLSGPCASANTPSGVMMRREAVARPFATRP